MKKVYQTDFKGNIKKYGCLFMSLVDIASEISGVGIRERHIEDLYSSLVHSGFMNSNCYVLNHTDTLNAVLKYFGSSIRMKYNGARYLDNINNSWGSNEGSYQILQVKTPSFSHFRRVRYDPWQPELKFNSVISVRYYSLA